MEIGKLDYVEPVQFAWEKVKGKLGLFIGAQLAGGAILTLILILMVATMAATSSKNSISPLFFLVYAVFWLALSVMQLGFFKLSLKTTDEQGAGFAGLVPSFAETLKFILAAILYSLIIFAGTILLVIPGIIWAIQFMFFGYFILDKGLGPIEALKASSKLTKGMKVDLIIFSLILYALNLVGELALFIGLLVTVPMTFVAMAHVYRVLLNRNEDTPQVQSAIKATAS